MSVSTIQKSLYLAALLCLCGSTSRAAASAVSFTSFDVSNASSYPVAGINDEGVIAGTWTADGVIFVGFIRSPGGFIAAPVIEPNDSEGFTVLRAINDEGVIAGFYGSTVSHGFLLTDGLFRTWDFPGAASTALRGINNRGDLSGTYFTDPNADPIGFIFPHNGTPVTFRYPDPAASGIVVGGINDQRAVAGYYTTGRGALAAFVRRPTGDFVNIVLPGADATFAYGLNDCGIIVGRYLVGSTFHGLYGRPGNLHTLDLPGAVETSALGINNWGSITGRYHDANGVLHAFVTKPIPSASCGE